MDNSLESSDSNNQVADLLPLTLLAIDHGEKRIGLAIKPAGRMLALPLGIIDAARETDAMESLRRLIAERSVNMVVVGLPLHQDSSQSQKVKKFTRRLREGIRGVRWRFVDETLSSHGALEKLRDAGFGGTTRKSIDDHAAILILEAFLQAPRRG